MIAQELNGTHIGHKVTVNSKDIATAGTLAGVQHEADLVTERTLGSNVDDYSVGRSTVLLVMLPDSIIRVEPTAEVELLD